MLRRLPDAEQPSRIDAAPLKTATTSSIAFGKGAAGFVAILLPLSATLPSPEARAHGSAAPRSPSLRAGTPGSPSPSISGLDVRALKSLYALVTVPRIPTAAATVPPPRRQIRARAHLVRQDRLWSTALIANDRALMERFILFAQAHDLLKKNAERAQKLAQDSNAALETYQREVRTL
ncbi:hypothetical protein EDB86DRAFT_3083723 [Lactarius hatsudake]|nr:hypothetical protein EDB86DRAFT_3083723 [Lactarius hatsudake]